MKNRTFPAQNITQKPASIIFHNSLGVLVRLSQAQKCLQSDPKPFKQVFLIFLFNWILCWLTHSLTYALTHWCLQPSITHHWIRLCPEMCFSPTAVHTMHASWTYLCPPLCSSSFHARCQVSIVQYGFPRAMHAFRFYFPHLEYSSFLRCSSFITLCNRRSIA